MDLKFKFGATFFFFFIILLSASLFSSSSLAAARRTPQFTKGSVDAVPHQEVTEEEAAAIHERLLRVNTKDYGRYNPAPALVRPPFKLIPN